MGMCGEKMRKFISTALMFISLLMLIIVPTYAADSDMSFSFSITSDGKSEKTVATGDIITVVLTLKRTDEESPYTMHSMQDELQYDSNFLELVDDSWVLMNGVKSTDIAMVDNHREFYMNYLSFSGGAQWKVTSTIGSVQFKVIGESGATKITNQDFLVSLPDGSGSYSCTASDLTLIITNECTVSFESNGGSVISNVTVKIGEKLDPFEAPVREGYSFGGWYTDIHLTEEWDYDTIIDSNITLYAKWIVSNDESSATTDEVVDPIEGGCNTFDISILVILIIIAIVIFALIYKRRKTKDSRNNQN